MVRLITSFILSSQSWEIGSPPTGGAGRMKLSCVVPASVILIWHIHTSWRRILHLSVNTVSVFWQFATFWWSAIILRYNSLLWMCTLNTLTWPDLNWPDMFVGNYADNDNALIKIVIRNPRPSFEPYDGMERRKKEMFHLMTHSTHFILRSYKNLI